MVQKWESEDAWAWALGNRQGHMQITCGLLEHNCFGYVKFAIFFSFGILLYCNYVNLPFKLHVHVHVHVPVSTS